MPSFSMPPLGFKAALVGLGLATSLPFPLSCLRTILKFQYQSRKFVPDNFSFARVDRKMLLEVFVVMVIYIRINENISIIDIFN